MSFRGRSPGTAHALNHALSLDYTAENSMTLRMLLKPMKCGGLGDVTGQAHGGILLRKHQAQTIPASVDRIPLRKNEVYCVVLGKLSTKSVLSNPEMVKIITSAGKVAMKKLLRSPSVDNFMLSSKDFTIDSKLAGEKVMEAIGGYAR
ncbi:MAG: hypothetical protein R2741_09235 [Methanolobus sp.]